MSKQLTSMQAAFCRHLTSGMTGAEAAREAGYASKYADRQASRLQTLPHVQAEIARLNAILEDEAIADATEIQQFLTSVMRGEVTEEVLSHGQLVSMPVPTRDRLRAGELLGRAQGMFTDRLDVSLSKDPALMTDEELEAALRDAGRL